MVAIPDGQTATPWRAAAEGAARRLAVITVTGAVLGVLIGGVGGRLAMMLLAGVNLRATGVISDDGFAIGELTLGGTAQLLGTGWQLGLLGAFAYALLRGLMIGPMWFRVASLSVGSGVVVAAIIVHTGGVDFTLLQPVPLTVGLFVLIPVLYAAALTVVVERWITADRWPAAGGLRTVLMTVLLWVPLLPVLPVLVLVWVVSEWIGRRRVPSGLSRVLPWLARAALAAVFLVAVEDLVGDIRSLT